MTKTATLYRMVMPDHLCPSGLRAKDLLERSGFAIDDKHLTTRADVDAFKADQGVKTTPQIFIDGTRIGGFEALRAHLGTTDTGVTYRPVIALFSVAALLAIAVTWQKLQDVEKFATMFLNYDLLAQRWVRYGFIYPFIETGAGLLMLMGALTWFAAPIALVASTIGAISVFKAVYIDKRELKCACVGGDSKVPLGFVSLTENLMMMGMSLWMLFNI